MDLLADLVIEQETCLVEKDIHISFQLFVVDIECKVVLALFHLLLAFRHVLDYWLFFLILRRGPVKAQLLHVDNLIALKDLFFQLLNICLVHFLDFVVAIKICFFEMFEFFLKLLELFSDALVLTRNVLVFDFVLLIGIDKIFA